MLRRLSRCAARRLSTRAGPLWTSAQGAGGRAEAAGVSGAAFSELLRKCGLSRRQLRALFAIQGEEAPEGEFPVAVALSGGGDSMALMLLLQEHLRHRQIRTPLLAITVDHQLRPESALEAQQLAEVCAEKWGVRHVTQRCEWAVKPRESKLEELARKYRYELLRDACREHGVRCLFVAHTLGDQLETTLFRLGRASGVNGLAGMASASPFVAPHDGDDEADLSYESEQAAVNRANVRLVRPLLSVTKAELRATCNRFKQPWIEDPTNNNLAYDRVRIRKELERLEAGHGKSVLDLLSRFQQTAALAKREFARLERRMLRKYVTRRSPDLVVLQMSFHDDPDMFDELRNRIISDLIVEVGSKKTPPRLESVIRLIENLEYLEVGKTVTLGGCKVTIKDKGRQLHFRPEVSKVIHRS